MKNCVVGKCPKKSKVVGKCPKLEVGKCPRKNRKLENVLSYSGFQWFEIKFQ